MSGCEMWSSYYPSENHLFVMEHQAPQGPATPTEPSEETAIAAALTAVSIDQWDKLWAAVDAVTAEESHATWAGGDVVDTTIVDGVERPVIQMPYAVYSAPMERLLELIGELGLVVPFDWMSWDGLDRYRTGDRWAQAPVTDAVRTITAIVRSERFCDGAIGGAWRDGTLPSALARLRSHWTPATSQPLGRVPAGDRLRSMTRAWLIRAGEGAVALDAMRHVGVIAVRYPSVGDATVWSDGRIEQALGDVGRANAAGQLRARIQAFAKEVGVGDLVVTPNTADREVWFARVTGPYQHSQQPPVESYFHWREVQWLGAIDRDTALQHDRLADIDQQPTIYGLRDPEYWNGVAATPLSNGADALTARAARRTPTVASKQPKARIACAGGCGLTWEQPALVDGLCPDCRS